MELIENRLGLFLPYSSPFVRAPISGFLIFVLPVANIASRSHIRRA